jgi:hypothetical protein
MARNSVNLDSEVFSRHLHRKKVGNVRKQMGGCFVLLSLFLKLHCCVAQDGLEDTPTQRRRQKSLNMKVTLCDACHAGTQSRTFTQAGKDIIMQVLPLELRSLITELLVSSPNSLAALARTHSSYQREAEKALYNTISVSIHRDSYQDLRCMETLATNSEKAALVRSLSFEYYSRYHTMTIPRVSTYLLKSLINMHALSDLRVRSIPNEVSDSEVEIQMVKGLGKILWSVCKV